MNYDYQERPLIWIEHSSAESGLVKNGNPWVNVGEVRVYNISKKLWWR